jgi:hypothetical protein
MTDMKTIIIAIVLTFAASAAMAHHYSGHNQCRTSSGVTYYC